MDGIVRTSIASYFKFSSLLSGIEPLVTGRILLEMDQY